MRIKLIFTLTLIGLLASGCAQNTTPEADYDKIDLMHYEYCLKFSLEAPTNNKYNFYAEIETDRAILNCQKFLPLKK
jgi:hypothetical protein